MGWGLIIDGVTLFVKKKVTLKGLWLNRVRKEDLQDELREVDDMIDYFKRKLTAAIAYSGLTVKDGEEEMSLIDYATFTTVDLMEDYDEMVIKKFLIEHALEFPENSTLDE